MPPSSPQSDEPCPYGKVLEPDLDMSARRPVTGFTITELMVVIAVLGVMLAIAIPAYSGSRER